jgi:hypothetical protein
VAGTRRGGENSDTNRAQLAGGTQTGAAMRIGEFILIVGAIWLVYEYPVLLLTLPAIAMLAHMMCQEEPPRNDR